MDDQRIEIAGIGEGTAHHQRIHHALVAVREGDSACGLEEADFGHFIAFHPLGQRGHGVNIDDRGVARAAQDKVHGRRIVDDGFGIWLADDGGDATGSCGETGRGKSLAMARAGFAHKGAHVHEARRDDLAGAINNVCAFRHARSSDAPAGVADHAVGNQHIAGAINIPRRIDQPGVGEQDGAAICTHMVHALGRLRASASSTAMRTATPISTCSRISDCAPSATMESISTPRFIGPGCITSASGLA